MYIGDATANGLVCSRNKENPEENNFDLGPNTVTWTATDPSNNSSTGTQTITVVDTIAPTAPVITFTQPSDYQAGTWTKEDVKFTIGDGIDYGTDNGSGVKKYQYRYNRIREAEVANAPELAPSLQWQSQNIWHDYTGEVKVSWTGKYYIEARTVDNAGNLSQIVSTQVGLIRSPTSPRITINEFRRYSIRRIT